MKLIKVALLFFLSAALLSGQNVVDMEVNHYFPQLVALSDWEAQMYATNRSDYAGSFTIKPFNQDGTPASLVSSLGFGSSFTVSIAPGEVKETLFPRTSNGFVGWVKVISSLDLGLSLTLRQYNPGTDTVAARAEVRETSPQHVSMVALNPEFGLALANPTKNSANVTVTARDNSGKQVKAVNFTLQPGFHIARYFREEPFSLGTQTGTVIVSSSVPVIAGAFGFEGLVFSTVPVQSAPRKAESAQVSSLVGTWYFVPAGMAAQPNVALRTQTAYAATQTVISRDMPRYGYPDKRFRVAGDAQGLPQVIIVPGKKTREEYFTFNNGRYTLDLDAIIAECAKFAGAEWNQASHRTIWLEISKIVNSQFADLGWFFYGGGNDTALENNMFLNAVILPFLRTDSWGKAGSYIGAPIPELGNARMPRLGPAVTWDELYDESLQIFAHEFGHNMGILEHDTSNPDLSKITLVSMMDNAGVKGFLRPGAQARGGLLANEASLLNSAPALNPNDYDWVDKDMTTPVVRVTGREWSGNVLRVRFSADDPESSVVSVAVHSWYWAPWTFFWKELGHEDQGEIEISVSVPAGATDKPLQLFVKNSKGGTRTVSLD